MRPNWTKIKKSHRGLHCKEAWQALSLIKRNQTYPIPYRYSPQTASRSFSIILQIVNRCNKKTGQQKKSAALSLFFTYLSCSAYPHAFTGQSINSSQIVLTQLLPPSRLYDSNRFTISLRPQAGTCLSGKYLKYSRVMLSRRSESWDSWKCVINS